MSDKYLSAFTAPQDTAGAIQKLKSRGLRVRDRGIRMLWAACVTTLSALGAYLLTDQARLRVLRVALLLRWPLCTAWLLLYGCLGPQR